MEIKTEYKPRPIRFLERYQHDDWNLKVYSISFNAEIVKEEDLHLAKTYLSEWLKSSDDYNLASYKIATLILHEFRDGVFAIINWWIGENMLQNFVYLRENNQKHFKLYSNNGMATCVWEMAVWWHERNAWVNHILRQSTNPDWEAYLNDQLNIDI